MVLAVNVKRSWEAMIKGERSSEWYRESPYECTRKYWNISDSNASEATLILGCYNGVVVEVIRVRAWHVEPDGVWAGRKVFEGEEMPDSPYMGADGRERFGSLANFRVKYITVDN